MHKQAYLLLETLAHRYYYYYKLEKKHCLDAAGEYVPGGYNVFNFRHQ